MRKQFVFVFIVIAVVLLSTVAGVATAAIMVGADKPSRDLRILGKLDTPSISGKPLY